MTAPCQCDGPNPACFRAGRPMTASLHAVCSTRPDYRELWDRLYGGRDCSGLTAPPAACPYFGPVAEAAACGCPGKAVHWCLSPHADAPDRCTVGPSADPDAVRTCTPGCPFR